MGLKLILFFCLFACRMEKGHEEASISQARCKKGTPRETPTVSSLVATMFVEELRLFSQVPADIRLKVANDTVAPTIRGQIIPFISPVSSFLPNFASLSRLW